KLAANWELIVTPFDSPAVLTEAVKAGYVPDHFETVLGQTVRINNFELSAGVEIEEVAEDPTEWALVLDAAWQERNELAETPPPMALAFPALPAKRYLARVNGEPAAAASLARSGDEYLLV